MTNKDILNWILGNFAVSNQSRGEVRFPCPKCGYENFYFNLNKLIGWCHKAKCHSKPTLQDLIDEVGYSPEQAGYIPSIDNAKPEVCVKPALPKGCWSVIEKQDQWAIDCLAQRGVSIEDIARFDIHADDLSVIVPVRECGNLVNYVRRFVDRSSTGFVKEGKRYEYCTGVKTNDYLFDWDKAKHWNYLVLVENTFNAIWLHDLNVTTNFGSYLSKTQQQKILKSKCKKVIILWDENANYSQPVKALKSIGIPAVDVKMIGQPDDYTKKQVEEFIQDCL